MIEIQKKKKENTVIKIKNVLNVFDGHICGVYLAEERIFDLKDKSKEFSKTERQGGQRLKKQKRIYEDWNNYKCNMRSMETPEREEREKGTEIFETKLTENFCKLMSEARTQGEY